MTQPLSYDTWNLTITAYTGLGEGQSSPSLETNRNRDPSTTAACQSSETRRLEKLLRPRFSCPRNTLLLLLLLLAAAVAERSATDR